MTVELRPQASDVEKAIVGYFEANADTLPGKAAVGRNRRAAFDVFRAAGLPNRRVEAWKYTDLRSQLRRALPPAERPSLNAAADALRIAPDPLESLERYRLVLVDGYFFPEFSDRTGLIAAGVEVASLAEMLATDSDAAAALMAAPALANDDVAVALNAAFAPDGVIIAVREGADIDKPIELVHVATAAGGRTATVRNTVEIGANASVRLVESYRGPAGEGYQTNAMTTVRADPGARLTHARLQAEGTEAVHLGSTVMSLAAGATANHLTVTAGARLSRAQIFLTTGGEHTRVGLHGATMLRGSQHADATLVIDHALPGAATRVLYKSAVDDQAKGIFQGKIIVEQDAQKTDAKMISQALLLSDAAEFDSKPELEIYADDVQCGHGATSGEIDEDELFYLMSRGIARDDAEELLIAAFLDDAVDALDDPQIGEALKATVARWLAYRAEDGA